MNSEERREFIIKELEENHAVKILDLSKRLKVTRETIRKDLYHLRVGQRNFEDEKRDRGYQYDSYREPFVGK